MDYFARWSVSLSVRRYRLLPSLGWVGLYRVSVFFKVFALWNVVGPFMTDGFRLKRHYSAACVYLGLDPAPPSALCLLCQTHRFIFFYCRSYNMLKYVGSCGAALVFLGRFFLDLMGSTPFLLCSSSVGLFGCLVRGHLVPAARDL